MSPAMAENIKKAQSIEADAAKKAGTTYVDVEAPMGHGEKVTPAETAPMKDIGNTSRNNNVNQQAAGTSYPIAPPMNSEGLKKQVELMAQNLEPVTTETLEIKLVKDDGAAGAAKSNGAMQNANGAAKFLGPVLASGLDIFGGYLSSPIDTDKTTFASATITGGKLDGAYLTGDTKRSESDVGLHFTAMQFNKKMYEIDAIALNEKTASDAMDGTVDRHVLTKYVFPIVLAAAGGFSQARAQTGSQVQSLGLGQNVLSVPAPTTEQATNAGIAKGLDVAAQANQQLASRPNQVTLNSKTPVGILFRKPVYEQ
jgi:hypothetical protein